MTESNERKDDSSIHQPFGCDEANLWVPPLAPYSLRKVQPRQHGTVTGQKPLKVKRRRTKRERDNAKFGKISETRSIGYVPRMHLAHPDFQHSMPGPPSATALKGTYVSNPVVITQNRLIQHLGIFNREVKSADIGRLLSEEMESERSAGGKGSETEKDVEEEVSSATKASLKEVAKASDLQLEKRGSGSPPRTVICSPKLVRNLSRNLPEASTAGLQAEGTEHLHILAVSSADGKENKPPGKTDSCPLKIPVKELSADLASQLNLHAVFPGRYLLSEAQKVILALLLDRHGKVPDVSEFAMRQKLSSSTNSFPSQAASYVEPRTFSEVETKGMGSKNLGDSAYRKRRRKQRFPRHFSMSPDTTPAHVLTKVVAEEPSQKNGLDLFEELRIYGHPGFCFTATANPEITSIPVEGATHLRSQTSRSDFPQSTEFAAQSLEEHFPAEMSWDTRSMLEKIKEDCEQSQKRNETHQYHFPFLKRDVIADGSSFLARNRELSQNFQTFTFPQQFRCGQVLSPKLCELQKELLREDLSVRHQGHIAKDHFVSRDIQSVEGTAPEAETSFDVLKSIWDSDVHREGTARVSGSKPSDCSSSNRLISSRCRTSYKGLCLEQGQLGSTLKLYTEGIYPKQSCPVCLLDNKASAQEYMAGMPRYTTKASVNKAAFRACHHELPLSPPCMAADQTGAQEWLESWEDKLPLAKSRLLTSQQEHVCKSHCGMGDCFYTLKPRHFLKQNLKLPLAFFPPSEALEHSCSPPPCFSSHGSSPEAWVFPRMKLY